MHQKSDVALKPKEFVKFELIEKVPVSHNTNILRFKLPVCFEKVPLIQIVVVNALISQI